MPRVSVIVPIFNSLAHLPAFFESLSAALPEGSQVIVVDDASTEPVLDAIPDLPHAETVIQLRNDQNLGGSGAVNRGLREATGEVVVQLNADLILHPDCIVAMIDLIEREKDVGIVGSKLIYPTTGRVQSVGMAFGLHSKRHVYRHLPADHALCLRTREVQITTGATVASTRKTLDLLGPLDEQMYNHNLDLDHCLRAVQHGLRNFMCADSVAYHWRNQSGAVRYARVEAAEAAFWATWGGRYTVDLGCFVDEALEEVLSGAPHLADVPFDVLDISRGADQPVALARLEAKWPGSSSRVRHFRQMHNPATRLWLPLVLPHWVATDPTPFIYLVDSHEDLVENALWFRRRRQVVTEELIVDLSATALTTSAFSVLNALPPDDQNRM